jgi:hypothetical protein
MSTMSENFAGWFAAVLFFAVLVFYLRKWFIEGLKGAAITNVITPRGNGGPNYPEPSFRESYFRESVWTWVSDVVSWGAVIWAAVAFIHWCWRHS